MDSPVVGVNVGDALLVAGYETTSAAADARLGLMTQLGEALLASATPWRIRRLAAHTCDRDVPSRGNLKRELDAMLARPAAARLVVLAGELTRTLEGLALVCAPVLGGFREDASVCLEWIALRLRRAAAVPTVVVVASSGSPATCRASLDAIGTGSGEHLIVVDAGEPHATLTVLLDGLWGEAVDLATGTVTPRSLGELIGRRRADAALQPSASTRDLFAPRGLARADLAERVAMRAAAPDELTDAVLPGHYRILDELGRGGFGVVYRAHQQLVDREVAVKVLPPGLTVGAVRRFTHEIRAIGRLDHPNVVRVLHADVLRDGRMFVAMERVAGRTLDRVLDGGSGFAPERALRLARQLVEGLAAAHAAGVVHADVKPSNIAVIEGDVPRLVLLDFGLAQLRDEDTASEPGGTPSCMAPEQLRGDAASPASDVHAAALVLLAMVAGEVPRGPDERERILARIPDTGARAAFTRALAADPAARFPSAVEFAAALDDRPIEPRAPKRPPFRIAAPLGEDDASDFFGRDQEIERLLEHVLFRRAVVYAAPSGTGKTSLLRAGLVPRLRQLGVDVVHVVCRAGAGPQVACGDGETTSVTDAMREALLRLRSTDSPRRLVVIVDQVEAALADARDPTRGAAVLEELGLPSWPLDTPATVLWSVREEYLARLLDRVQALEPGVPIVRLGPLSPAVAATIFEQTLAQRGLLAEEALVRTLVEDLMQAAAGLSVELGWSNVATVYPPHLQLAGAVLYEAHDGDALDLALYHRVGGLATILSEHLRHVIEGELSPAEGAIARELLVALVTSSHLRIACEQAELVARVARGDGVRTDESIMATLQFLRERGLVLAAPGPGGEPYWDLTHDSLIAQVEAYAAASDWTRRSALEVVRHHLRRSPPRPLGADALREVRRHLRPADLAALDDEWGARPGAGHHAATSLIATSRRALLKQRSAFGGVVVAALVVAGALAMRWRDERALRVREISLRDRDIGTTVLVLHAFDWDPLHQSDTDATGVDLRWTLVRPSPADHSLPGRAFAPGDLTVRPLPPPPGAVRADRIDARGGPAVLVVDRRDRQGLSCSPVIIPIARLAGRNASGAASQLSLRVPTCEATRAGMLAVPAGPFLAGGLGDPMSKDNVDYGYVAASLAVVSEFALDRTEVSNAALAAVADAFIAGGRTLPIYPDSDQLVEAGLPDRPVGSLTWFEAAAVCRLFGKRLPTSLEWQKAARGGLALGTAANPSPLRNLPWGSTIDLTRANIYRDATSFAPAGVGTHAADVGPYGHLDLAGNLTEWTADRRTDGFAILRGGNWAETNKDNLVDFNAIDNPRAPKSSMYTFGFRCAADR